MSKQARIGVSLEIDNLKELEKQLDELGGKSMAMGIDSKDAKSIEKLRQTVDQLALSVESLGKEKLNAKMLDGVADQLKTMAADINALEKGLGSVYAKLGNPDMAKEYEETVRNAKTAAITTNNMVRTTKDLYVAAKKVNKEGISPVADTDLKDVEKLKELLKEIGEGAKSKGKGVNQKKDESLIDYLTRLSDIAKKAQAAIDELRDARNDIENPDSIEAFSMDKQLQGMYKNIDRVYDTIEKELLKNIEEGDGSLKEVLSKKLGVDNALIYLSEVREDIETQLKYILEDAKAKFKEISGTVTSVKQKVAPKVTVTAKTSTESEPKQTNDGKIGVPVYPTASPNYIKQLQAIINIAQDYALKHPVRIQSEVEVRLLSPYLTNKNKRILEEIKDGLSEVEDEEIKTKVADLMDVINRELNPEVKIGISVDTRKAYAKISYAMEAIKKKLESTKLVLSPELEFSKITDDKIKSEFDKALSRQKVLDNFDYLNNLFDKNSKMDASGVKSAAEDIGLVKESGEKLGENFGEGYAEGVTKSSKKVKKSSKKMIKEDAIDTAAETQDSHSPSKVAEQLGVWFDEGYAEGVTGGADKVADAISEMIQNNVLKLTDLTGFNVPGAEEGIEFFEEIKAGIEKYISSIKPKFQNLYNTLDNLTNMWWAMKNIADNIDYDDVPATKQIVKNLTDAFDKYKQLEDGLKLKEGSKSFIDLFPLEQLKALDKIMKTSDNGLSKIKVDAENIEEALRDVVDTAEKSSEIDAHEWIGDFLKGEQEHLEALEKGKEAPKEVAKANKEASKEIIKANESIVNPVETVSKNVVDVVEETSKKVEKTVKKTVKRVQKKIEEFKPKKALFDDFVVPPSQYSSPNSYGDAFSTRHQDSYFGSLIPKLPLPSVSEPSKHKNNYSDVMGQFMPDSFADAFSTRHQDKYFDSLINHLQSVMAPLAAVNNEIEEVETKTEEVTKKASKKAKEVGETVSKESGKVKAKVKEATKSVSDEAKNVADETKNLDKTIQDLTFLSDEAYYRGDIEAFKKYEAQIASLTGRAREATKGFTDLDKAIDDAGEKKGIGIPLTERATVDREKEAGIYAWATEKADELAANLGEVLKIERQMDSEHESYIVNYENGMAILGKESESQLLFTRQELYNRAKLEKIDKDRVKAHNQEYKINQQIAKQTESYYEYYSKYGEKMKELLEGAIKNPLGNTKEYTPEYKKQLEEAKYELKRFQGLLGTHKDGKIFTFDDIARLDEFKDKIDEATKGLKDQNNVIMKSENLLKLYKKVNKDLNDNTAMPTKLRNEYEELQATLRKIVESGEEISAVYGRKLTNDFLRLSSTLEATGRTGNSLFRLITKAAKSQTAQLIARYFSLQDLIRYARQAFDTIRELDTALIDLRKTTSMSGKELEEFYYDSNEVARSLGVTTRAIIEQAAQWSRFNKIDLLYGNI